MAYFTYHKKDVEKKPTGTGSVIGYIAVFTEKCQIEPLARPWLPSLPERIPSKEIQDIDYKTV